MTFFGGLTSRGQQTSLSAEDYTIDPEDDGMEGAELPTPSLEENPVLASLHAQRSLQNQFDTRGSTATASSQQLVNGPYTLIYAEIC